MNFQQLCDEAWGAMPPIRKRIVGRDRVNRIVGDAISDWSPEYLAACQDNNQRDVYAADLSRRIERKFAGEKEYGFAIMTIILVAVISAVVQWLIKRWLDRRFNEEDVARWRKEMAGT